jgi:hypothetical protein
MSVYLTAILSISWPFGIFCGHLVYLVAIWYIFPRFGMLYQETSGNPADDPSLREPEFFRPCRFLSHFQKFSFRKKTREVKVPNRFSAKKFPIASRHSQAIVLTIVQFRRIFDPIAIALSNYRDSPNS